MEFEKYQHVEKIGHPEVDGLMIGECFIFPKIDGTNASIWLDGGKINCGSRNRHLSIEKDNAGFLEWATKQGNIKNYLQKHPNRRLFGEWLVPHTLKTYSDDSWMKFYVFDVVEYGDDKVEYISYDKYQAGLEEYGINYIPPMCIFVNPTVETVESYLDKNTFLIKDGCGVGEGVVIKNYDFRNRNGRAIWAKIVKNDFKTKNAKLWGVPRHVESRDVESDIVNAFVSDTLVDKEFSKLTLNQPWENKMIPRLLNTVFYCLVNEEIWQIVKKYKNPKIDFKRLQALTFAKVKKIKSDII